MPKPRRLLIDALWIAHALWAAGAALAADGDAARAANRVSLSDTASPALISVVEARSGNASSWLEANGVVIADPRSQQDINAYLTGQVRQVFVRTGDRVKAGTPLVSIYSPELIATQKSYLALVDNSEQLQYLREAGRLANYLKDARENLKWWGLSDAQIAMLEREGTLVQQLVLRAPGDGLIEQILVEPGSLINAGDKSMKAFIVTGKAIARMVSTTESYWIEGSVFADQLPLLRAGMRVKVTGPGAKPVEHALSKVLPDVDAATQRARFRVNLHPTAPWPPGTALRLSVQVPKADGIWVPREAVLGQHIAPAVYVRLTPHLYERRRVSVLAEAGADVQVTGVQPREAVVTAGKTLLEGAFRMSAAPARSANHHSH